MNDLINISVGDAAMTALLGYAVVFFGLILLMAVVIAMGKAFTAKENKAAAASQAAKAAVAAGYWFNFRYNPELALEGKNPFVLDSKEPTTSYKDFIKTETRYSSLGISFPERAEKLFDTAEQQAKDKYRALKKRAEIIE